MIPAAEAALPAPAAGGHLPSEPRHAGEIHRVVPTSPAEAVAKFQEGAGEEVLHEKHATQRRWCRFIAD